MCGFAVQFFPAEARPKKRNRAERTAIAKSNDVITTVFQF